MKRTVWIFGLISGAIVSVMMLITIPFEDRIGVDRGEIIGYTTMVLAFLLVFFGIRSYRENVGGGRVSFGRALAVGALITAVASVCYTVTWEVLFFGFKNDFATRYAAYEVQQARDAGATQAQIDARMKEMKRFSELYRNPLYNSAITFTEPLPVGLLVTLVSAGVLSRKRRRPTDVSGTVRTAAESM